MNIETNIIIDRIKKLENKLDWFNLSYNKKINYDIILEYKDKPWNFYTLLSNNILTIKDIKLLPDTDITWKYISMNNSLTIEYILENLDKPLNWDSISCNDIITIDIIDSYPNLPWNWNMISINKNINIDFIKKNLDKEWSIVLLSCNTSLSIEDILNNKDLFDWNWKDICRYHDLSLEQIRSIKDKPINWYYISKKKFINLDVVLKNIDLSWDWDVLSSHENISLEEIVNNPKLPWNWDYILSLHPKLTVEFLKKNYKKLRNVYYYYILTHKNLSFEDICDIFDNTNLFKNYNIWRVIIDNPNITFTDIVNNLDKDWDWYLISTSNKITYQDIINYPHLPWSWNFLSRNENIFDVKTSDIDYLEYVKKIICINRIKRAWFRCITDPEYKLCKRRLLGEFNEFYQLHI